MLLIIIKTKQSDNNSFKMIFIRFNSTLVLIFWALISSLIVTSSSESQLFCDSNKEVEAVDVKNWLAQLEDDGLKILEDAENFKSVSDAEMVSSDALCNPGEEITSMFSINIILLT